MVQVLNFARPQFENAFPEGAPTFLELFEEETGITVEFIETDPATEYPDNLRNASTRNGSFDLVTTAIEEIGDFAEAGLLLPLGEYVEKYQPSWNDPVYGFAGGEPTVNLFSKYKDEYYVVAFDNDTQPYFYRGDLMDDPKEQARVRGQVRPRAPLPDHLGRAGRGRGVLHAARPAALRRRLDGGAVLGRRQLERALRLLGEPEHALFQRRHVGQRQQRGRHPRLRGAEEGARVARARRRSRRTGSRSTS